MERVLEIFSQGNGDSDGPVMGYQSDESSDNARLGLGPNWNQPLAGVVSRTVAPPEPAQCPFQHPHYAFETRLASDQYSTVWKATDVRTHHKVAVKMVTRLSAHRLATHEALAEAEIMRYLAHPGIVRLLATPQIDGGIESLVMEFVVGGDLWSVLQKPDFDFERYNQGYMMNLCGALEYIHNEGFVHNDVKLENVLVAADLSHVKLCDFGLSGQIGERRVGIVEGTLSYMAPELLEVKRGEQYRLDIRTDIYALGVLFHGIIFAFLPWTVADEEHDQRYCAYMANPDVWNDAEWAILSNDFRCCLQYMWCEPEMRVNLVDVVEVLEGCLFKEDTYDSFDVEEADD